MSRRNYYSDGHASYHGSGLVNWYGSSSRRSRAESIDPYARSSGPNHGRRYEAYTPDASAGAAYESYRVQREREESAMRRAEEERRAAREREEERRREQIREEQHEQKRSQREYDRMQREAARNRNLRNEGHPDYQIDASDFGTWRGSLDDRAYGRRRSSGQSVEGGARDVRHLYRPSTRTRRWYER